jgi:hypothetical protein
LRLKRVQSQGIIPFALNGADLSDKAGSAVLDELAKVADS